MKIFMDEIFKSRENPRYISLSHQKKKNVNSLFLRQDINLSINSDAERMHLQKGFISGGSSTRICREKCSPYSWLAGLRPTNVHLSINHFVARIIYEIAPRSLVTPVQKSVTRIVRNMARTRIYSLYVRIPGYFMLIIECALMRD